MLMQIKKIVPICFLAAATLPVIAHADIEIFNNTDTYGTAKIDGRCTANYESGIISPRSKIVIPQFLLNTLCLFSDCEVAIYASKTCDGKVVGTATLNRSKGVTRAQSVDKNYEVVGLGKHIEIKFIGIKRGFMNWLKSLF